MNNNDTLNELGKKAVDNNLMRLLPLKQRDFIRDVYESNKYTSLMKRNIEWLAIGYVMGALSIKEVSNAITKLQEEVGVR